MERHSVDHGLMRFYYAPFIILFFVSAGNARSAEMCAPNTNPVVCSIIEERNNSLDELAKAEGGRREVVAQQEAERAYWKKYTEGEPEQARQRETDRQALAEWWKAYVSGLPDGVTLVAHIDRACAWKGTLNEPTAQLCAWWKGLAR